MLRRTSIFATLLILAFVPAVLAAPKANLKINPTKPYSDDNIRVSFTSPAPLEPGFTYDVTIVGKGSCSDSVASKTVKPPKAAGKRITVKFRPTDEVVREASEWCHGKWSASVTRAQDGEFDKNIARKTFRIRKKP